MFQNFDAYKLYLALQFLTGFSFSMIFVVGSLYEATVANLSGMQLVLVGTTLELTVLLFEVPTGIVADAYSRKLSIIIGFFLMGIAFLIEGSFPIFGIILLVQVLWGLGYTFTSGATQAWLSDEIGEENANRAFLRGNQFDLAGSFLGMLVAIPLGNLAVNVPILVGGAMIVLTGLALALFMPEHGFKPIPRENRNSFQHMAEIFKKGIAVVRSRPGAGLHPRHRLHLWVIFRRLGSPMGEVPRGQLPPTESLRHERGSLLRNPARRLRCCSPSSPHGKWRNASMRVTRPRSLAPCCGSLSSSPPPS